MAEEKIAQLKKELARERAENAQLGQILEEMLRRPGDVEGCILMRWHRLVLACTAIKVPPAL